MSKFCFRLHNFKVLCVSWNSLQVLIYPAAFCHSYLKISSKFVHSVHQFKQNRSRGRFQQRNSRQYLKLIDEDVDPKTYMRDTVGKIYKILKYSTWDSAQDRLQSLPIRWDSYTVNQVLKTHPPLEKAWLFFNWAAGLKEFKHDQFTYTTMLDIFGEAGRVSSMNYVFKQMQEKEINIDAVTYTSLMHWTSSSGDVDGAIKVWKEMRTNGCSPTVVSYTAYMKVLFNNDKVKEATDVYKEMLQSRLSPNCYTYTVLMEYLIGSGKCNEALEIFSKMQEAGEPPDKAACNILVEKLSKSGETWALSQILQYMKENHIVLRYPVFVEAFQALKVAGESDLLLREANPHCTIESVCKDSGRTIAADIHSTIDEGLVLILLKKGNLIAVDGLLAQIADKNTRLGSELISTIIEVNSNHCRPEGALLAFEYSMKSGTIIARNSYLALIGALIRSNMCPKLVKVVEEMIKARHSVGPYLASVVIHKLGSAGKPKCAAKIFNLLPVDHKCTATYTALIGVYFSVGNFDKGLEVFKTMQRYRVRPSLGTYTVILAGFSRSGSRVSELEYFRKEKKRLQLHGQSQDITPIEEKICDLIFLGDVVS
ncbi:Tetratricopeptide-like helical domain containing protein [Trema orientale]|uniref:Tetratricopeptide-like helical domain containing protein n=1 Tax=Trema orientale TaxID=63057 RepID=A0A2P5EIQ0_TREOI|nr:Tetratricopeptide-like helical domain containing protein [Trema orientale]